MDKRIKLYYSFLVQYDSIMKRLIIIGGGLSGCEAAWQVAQRGIEVNLFEMRPLKFTEAHTSSQLGELVCSNSLGSSLLNRASGLLKEEIRRLDSLLLKCAEETKLPAGGALAVDRTAFADLVTNTISNHPNIRVIRQEVTVIPDQPVIIASGPLTSPGLSHALSRITEREHLFFYDAVAPIIAKDSIDMSIAFRASRYDRGILPDGDYINCPLTKSQYIDFINALRDAECVDMKGFESVIRKGVTAGVHEYFEGCLPVEVLARRSPEALSFGPLRSTGLYDHHAGAERLYAVLQLRQDNVADTLYNMVGFQTNLKQTEQLRIFRMVPGLEHAHFIRFGQMHRNTFIFSPALLFPTFQFRKREDIFFAGQITGIEGYIGNIASGLLAGINAANLLVDKPLIQFPDTTMIGALCRYICTASEQDFQPMKPNFGLLPKSQEIQQIRNRQERAKVHSELALNTLDKFLESQEPIKV
jgi:methylenetetrahydrofolate--tRNA-(uracil-5-)-methyltransferase